jgi:hypothetical protein
MNRVAILALFVSGFVLGCGEVTGTGPGVQDTSAPGDTNPQDIVMVKPCEGKVQGAACDDNDPCTLDDRCSAGLCVGGSNDPCETDDPCQSGTCIAGEGCKFDMSEDGSPCGVACFETASCVAGSCQADGATKMTCPLPGSDQPCLSELACDPSTGQCTVEVLAQTGSSCDTDSDLCSLESCTAEGACEATDEVNDCAGEKSDDPCQLWQCSKKTGDCQPKGFAGEISCDDGNACTKNDTCYKDEFSFVGCLGKPVPVDDNNPCTDDACVDGTVEHTPINGQPCDTGDACTPVGLCDAGECQFEPCGCTKDADCDQPGDPCMGVAYCDVAANAPSCKIKEGSVVSCPADSVCVDGECKKDCEPVDGGWSDWKCGACSALCDGGFSLCVRECTNPAPACGGQACQGPGSKEESCNMQACGNDLPMGKTVYSQGEEVVTGTVPEGVFSLDVAMWGGGGSGGGPGTGGGGAFVHGKVSVNPGDNVELRVAGGGGLDGGGGGASYLFVNDTLMIVAAGGGGGGSDGCSGCHDPGTTASAGGAGGGVGEPGQAGEADNTYNAFMAGGGGASAAMGGTGGVANNQSMYQTCTVNGEAGIAHQGGRDGMGGNCTLSQSPASYHLGGTGGGVGNGHGGGGGSGYFGGGSGAAMWTYNGGGGGGSSSWVADKVTVTASESGMYQPPGGTANPSYQGQAGRGGEAKKGAVKPTAGKPGLIVLSM